MPVVVQYVVERDGETKMTFASKQQADAYDKMLDMAEMVEQILVRSELVAENQIEALSLYLAQQKDELLQVLQGKAKAGKPVKNTETPEMNNVEAISEAMPCETAEFATAA